MRVRVRAINDLTDSQGGSQVPAGTLGWATPDNGVWRATFDNGQRYSASSVLPVPRRGFEACERALQPHYPTPAELADQRRAFVTDTNTHRPYHYLALALVKRGLDALDAAKHGRSMMRVARADDRYFKGYDEAGRTMRMYRTELPHTLTFDTDIFDKWQEALLKGPRIKAWLLCNEALDEGTPGRRCEHPDEHMEGTWS